MSRQELPFVLPRSTAVRWLLGSGKSRDAAVQRELHRTILRGTVPLAIGSAGTIVVWALAFARTGWWPFALFIFLDVFFLALRMLAVLVIRHPGGRNGLRADTATDIFVAAALAWFTQVGAGVFLTLTCGEPAVAVYGVMLAFTVASSCGPRNPGCPRQTQLQMLLVVVPTAAGAVLSPISGLIWVAWLTPLVAFGLMSVTRRLHSDFIELIEARLRSSHAALHCGLTGLPNRARFDQVLERSLRSDPYGVIVLCIDLDGFKAVNDEFGHQAGDEVLREVATRLTSIVPSDAVAARWGGDEFAVLLIGFGEAAVESIGRGVIRELCRPYELLNGARVHIGGSLGIASSERSGSDAYGLLRKADKALYLAKHSGKGVLRWADMPSDPVQNAVEQLRAALTEMAADPVNGDASRGSDGAPPPVARYSG